MGGRPKAFHIDVGGRATDMAWAYWSRDDLQGVRELVNYETGELMARISRPIPSRLRLAGWNVVRLGRYRNEIRVAHDFDAANELIFRMIASCPLDPPPLPQFRMSMEHQKIDPLDMKGARAPLSDMRIYKEIDAVTRSMASLFDATRSGRSVDIRALHALRDDLHRAASVLASPLTTPTEQVREHPAYIYLDRLVAWARPFLGVGTDWTDRRKVAMAWRGGTTALKLKR